MADAAELASEQAYFDEALEWRERERHRLGDVPRAAANPKDAVGLKRRVDGVLRGFRPPEDAVAFGRIDSEDDERFYIGYQLITDGDNEPLVINWQTPLGTLFYEANHDDPQGLARRRQYTCDGNTIRDFEDVVFAELIEQVVRLEEPGELDDALLEDLERSRTGEMLDIVRTIRAAQHRIIRDKLDQLLLVQGGPGTGKTAVALHRVSWLLFNHRENLGPSDVAVIGPNPTFIRYIRNVLPSLGDHDVRQLALGALGPQVRLGREERPEVVRLKGEARMADLLDRALDDRVFLPDGPLVVPVGTRSIRLDRARVQAEIDRLRSAPYSTGRQSLRSFLRAELLTQLAPSAPDLRPDVVDGLLERIWPQLTAPAFLQELLGSEARLLRAAGDEFTAREVRLLYRRSADRLSEEVWSSADVPLLDHAAERIGGQAVERFRHVVVDEAQDLSPMQLASIRRRSSNGSMTVLGDLAQSTGHWARDSWDDVLDALSHDEASTAVAELEIGYRVPRQAFELAAHLLPAAAPGVAPPRVVRDGPDPILAKVDGPRDRVQRVAHEAMGYAGRSLLVGVICPASLREDITSELSARGVRWRDAGAEGLGTGINILGPPDAKGLEFDAVVVVEPERIVAEYERGDRLLYVALTRTTHHLSVVHVGAPLPTLVLAGAPPEPVTAPQPVRSAEPRQADVLPQGTGEEEPSPPRVVHLLAESLAVEIRDSLPAHLWSELLEQLRDRLDESV